MSDHDRPALGAYRAQLSRDEQWVLDAEARRRETEPTNVRAAEEERLRAQADPEAEATLRGSHPGLFTAANDWPTLERPALYGLAGEVVATIAPYSEADEAGLLVTLLTCFGAAVGRGPHAVAQSDEHPARLNTVLVGETAKSRKGSSFAPMRRVFEVADPGFMKTRIMSGFGSGEAVVDQVKDGEDERLLIVEGEFSRILRVSERKGSTLSAIVRDAWDGRPLQVRSRSGTSVAPAAHVCLLAHITADELRAQLTATDIANGYGNRHLFACVKKSKDLPSGGELDDRTVAELGAKVRDRLTEARKRSILRRSEEAEAYWSDLYFKMSDDDPGGLLAAIIARDAAQTLRLSVAYALTEGARRIEVPHVEAAWAVWRYCRASAAHIFGGRTGDDVADRLLDEVEATFPGGLDRVAQHALFGRNFGARRLEVARDRLFRLGLAEEVEERTNGRPRVVLKAVL